MNKNNINISFCYDKNFWKQFCVAISSLLIVSKNKCSYNIFCVISDDIDLNIQSKITNIVKTIDSKSTIHFFTDNHDFKNPKPGHSSGFYFRLQLPKQLTNIDKIIYCDTDIVFQDSLIDLYNIDMHNNLLMGVKDGMNMKKPWSKYITKTDTKYIVERGNYINSGVILMNIKLFQQENLYPKFLNLVDKKLKHKDQDMLNYICQNRIGYIPLKYNFTPKSNHKYKNMLKEQLLTKSDIYEANKNPIILHFISKNPWETITPKANIWWEYAKLTPFYNDFKKTFFQKASLLSKIKFLLMHKKGNN